MSNTTRLSKWLSVVSAGALALGLAACGSGSDSTDTSTSTSSEAVETSTPADTGTSEAPAGGGEGKVVGFVAVGPEGAWRDANEAEMQESFKAAGFDLKYAPATNPKDQASQIASFSTFVNDGVDVILLSATEATGWEDSLKKAQDAEIPVVLIDRGIDPDDTSLYATRIAPNNVEVAANVGKWANETFPDGANYFVLEGPTGIGVVAERNQGWDSVVGSNAKLVKVGAQTANWSTEEAKSVFETALKANNNDIQLVFAQNDEMGLGAVQAVEAAGLKPGEDVKIATIDGTKNAIQALADGKLSFVAEYNPLFGATAIEAVNTLLDGGTVEQQIIVPSAVFASADEAAAALPDRKF